MVIAAIIAVIITAVSGVIIWTDARNQEIFFSMKEEEDRLTAENEDLRRELQERGPATPSWEQAKQDPIWKAYFDLK